MKVLYVILILSIVSCSIHNSRYGDINNDLTANILDYSGIPSSPRDRDSLTFSDQGAWFSYGFPTKPEHYGGFSGPFLMTQENGVWSSKVLSRLELIDFNTKIPVNWNRFTASFKGFNSHLEQVHKSDRLKISQTLFFTSPHTALITTRIKNLSNHEIELQPHWTGNTFLKSLQFKRKDNTITITSAKSTAIGYIQVLGDSIRTIHLTDTSYSIKLKNFKLKPGETSLLLLIQSFIFPEYDINIENERNSLLTTNYQKQFKLRIIEKEKQVQSLYYKPDLIWNDPIYRDLLAKAVLTMQNNWRIPSGELKHSGLFPSYHYVWFHGFWAWDSWKHAVALAQYDIKLAKEQIKAMYDFQKENGLIADCVYRDTSIEDHNYRNTKPPLSAWAVWKVYQQDKDLNFLKELYPKIIKQHSWWYANRDHDKDGICEYGSTDGSVKAAKWESGMDNAVRFDNSQILENSKTAFSLNQESVDLNAYLYAEKKYLIKISKSLKQKEESAVFKTEAEILKIKIQSQFFDTKTGWFYDTSLDGKTFIKAMGCEGWIPLWAEAATPKQAEAVKKNMMNPKLFNTKMPFQTLSANHPKFKPDGGYWRGPTWLDQAYFGIKGLFNYGYFQEAKEATYKLIHNAEGVLSKGNSIRENYDPITGKGLESENFSWSAAFYLLLLING